MLTSLSSGISTVQTILFRIWKSVPSHPSRVATIAARDRKGVSFSSLELLIPIGSTNAFPFFNDLISFCLCLAWEDRNISLYTVFPWFCFHFYWMQIFIPLGLWRFLLGQVYGSPLKIASDLLVVARSLICLFLFLTFHWLIFVTCLALV